MNEAPPREHAPGEEVRRYRRAGHDERLGRLNPGEGVETVGGKAVEGREKGRVPDPVAKLADAMEG